MKYLSVLGAALVAWLGALAQVVLVLPLLALIMLVAYPPTSWALAKAWLVQCLALTVPFVVPFIMTPQGPQSVRWRLYNTTDDLGIDQGGYEPQVILVQHACGWRWKTFYWLAARNVCFGASNRLRPQYDFATAGYTVNDSRIVMTWKGGSAVQHNWPWFSGPRIMFGYAIHAYLNSLDPLEVNPHIDMNPDTDVGGVPFFTVRFK